MFCRPFQPGYRLGIIPFGTCALAVTQAQCIMDISFQLQVIFFVSPHLIRFRQVLKCLLRIFFTTDASQAIPAILVLRLPVPQLCCLAVKFARLHQICLFDILCFLIALCGPSLFFFVCLALFPCQIIFFFSSEKSPDSIYIDSNYHYVTGRIKSYEKQQQNNSCDQSISKEFIFSQFFPDKFHIDHNCSDRCRKQHQRYNSS